MRAQAPKGEAIYIAMLDSHIVAALRLSPVANGFLLRSMCVASELRQQGVGSYLLQQIQEELDNIDCYCFPYSHLNEFYTRAGFQLISSAVAPEAIRDKFNRYLHSGKDICLMKHSRSVVE